MEWPSKITDEPGIESFDPLGKWFVCRICHKCNDPRSMIIARRDFKACRWYDHQSTSYHKTNTNTVSADASNKRNQTTLMFHFSAANKKAKSLGKVIEEEAPATLVRTTKSCEGILANAYKKGAIREHLMYFARYAVTPTTATSTYLLRGGAGSPQLFSVECNDNGKARSKSSGQGLRCDKCEQMREKSGRKIRQRLKNKFIRYREIEDILRTSRIADSQILRLTNFAKTPQGDLNPLGQQLMNQVEAHVQYYKNAKRRSESMMESTVDHMESPDKFLAGFLEMYSKHKEKFSMSLLHGLIEAAIAKMSGYANPEFAVKVINFYSVLEASGRKGFNIASANLFGPSLRTIQRHSRRLRGSAEQSPAFLTDRKDHVKDRLRKFISLTMTDASMKPTFSIAIDATKVPPVLQYSRKYGAIIGECAPKQMVCVLDGVSPEELKKLLDPKGKQLASEVKVAVLTLQNCPKGMCPYITIAGRAQSKNENSKFNEDIHEACIEFARETEGVTYLSASNDGVSCDSKFVRTTTIAFLRGLVDQTASTDTNHNTKNFRYQGVIGGNSIPVMGSACVDCGLLLDAGIPYELIRVSDFASDLLVLKLASSETAGKIMSLENQDSDSVFVTCLTLYFMRAHLFGVNSKECDANHRVSLIWSSAIWMTTLKGVSVLTQRNIMSGAVSMCFLVMRSDVLNPRYLTSEPNEHTFGTMRAIKREFTVQEMCDIVDKLWRLLSGLFKGGLLKYRDPQKGDSATFDDFQGHILDDSTVSAGPVDVSDLKEGEIARTIWMSLFCQLNSINEHMRRLLKTVFNVEDDDLSPFCMTFTKDISSIRDCYVSFMNMAGNNTNTTAEQSEEDSTHNDQQENETNTSVELAEAMAAEIVQCGADVDDTADDDHEDNPVDHSFVQSIYGHTDADSIVQTFGNLISMSDGDRSNWRNIMNDAFQALKMKGREQGSISSGQKFKGLNYRWFGRKVKEGDGSEKPCGDSANVIKRGTVVVIKEHPTKQFLVLTVFSKHYNKWFPTQDTPSWIPSLTDSPYRISIREVWYDCVLCRYEHAKVSITNGGDDIYQLVNMQVVVSVTEQLH
jgi:hypothetical protein